MTVKSNSPTTLRDLLVKADFPFGFDYTAAEPDPDAGQDTWRIAKLDPEGEEVIKVRGIIVGKENEERVFRVSVGVSNETDRYDLASTFAAATTEIDIEQPFLGISLSVNGDTSPSVVVSKSQSATARITFNNTLEDAIYDGIVEVALSGNALDEIKVKANDGFYDSQSNTIRWDSVDVEELGEISPGRNAAVSFTLTPNPSTSRTPEITISVTAKGQRIYEDRVPQELVGTVSSVVRVESITTLTSAANYSSGPFNNSGPIPPIAEETTSYTLQFSLQNGSNELKDAEMTAVLPQYVKWLDRVSAGDDVSFDSVNRLLTWKIGEVDSNDTERLSVQVSITPSFSQVNTAPTLIETQRFRAVDRFTDTVVRSDAPALTTKLEDGSETGPYNGRVQEPE